MELVKTASLTPGKDIFFYRDQNGVEIDFVIEKAGSVTLIEAKAREQVDQRKLNFRKVAPLLRNKYSVRKIVASNVPTDTILDLKNFQSFNPLRCSLPDQLKRHGERHGTDT
jgi:predicted AAA+ superfamily ATPase